MTCIYSSSVYVSDLAVTEVASAPVLTVTKTLGSNRITDTDQFTVQIVQNSASVVNPTTNSTTTGSGATVTPGSGTTGATTLVSGTQYMIKEVAAGTTKLEQYASTLVCTDATGAKRALAMNTVFSLQNDDVIICSITNTLATASLTLTQLIISPFPVNLLPPFTFDYSINNGWPAQPQRLTTSAFNVPVSTAATKLAATNVATTLSTSLPDARWFVSSFACADTKAAVTGNPVGNFLRVVGTSITIPAGNVRPGSALRCTLTMGHKVP